MTSISAVTSSSALALTKPKTANAATVFLVSMSLAGTSSAVRKDLLSQFYNKGLAQEFAAADAKHRAERDPNGNPIPPEQAHMEALTDVINAHRESFNPDEFTLTAALPGGASSTVTIQSAAAMSADIFKRQVDAKQADYDAAAAAKDAKPDPDAVKLDALNQALQSLQPNSNAPTDGDATDAKTAYAILTKKRYGDDQDSPDKADQPGDQPGTATSLGQAANPSDQGVGDAKA